MGTAQNRDHVEVGAADAAASAIGRVIWTFFAFIFVLIGWGAATKALLNTHQIWAYALFTITTLLFIAFIAGLRILWRDNRYW